MNINFGTAQFAPAGGPNLWGTLLTPWSGNAWDYPRPPVTPMFNPVTPSLMNIVQTANGIQNAPIINVSGFNTYMQNVNPNGKTI